MTGSRVRTPGLLVRHLSTGVGASVLVAVLVGLAVLAVAIAPRALVRLGTAELTAELDAQPAVNVDLTGTGRFGVPEGEPDADLATLAGPTDQALRETRDGLEPPLRDAVGDPVWVARSSPDDLDADGTRPAMVLDLAFDLTWPDRVAFVAGAAPRPWTGEAGAVATAQPPLEVAISSGLATATGLAVGDELPFQEFVLRITGVYAPLDDADPYWAHTTDLAQPAVDREPGTPPVVHAGVYPAPESLAGLVAPFNSGTITTWLPVDPGAIDYADLDRVQTQARQLQVAQVNLPFAGSATFRSGLPDLLELVRSRVTSASALLALCVSGLFGVLAAALALGVRAVVARRAPALALTAARGASGLQLRGAMALEGLLVSLPVSALALAVAVLLVPADAGPAGWIAPAVVALTPPALFVALSSPRGLLARRGDLRMRGRSRARGIAELAVVALAVVAVVLLARRGLVASSAAVGIDPLLAATPLLLALAGCVGALRLYPVPLLAAQRALRRTAGATGPLGAARAARDPALGFAAALALVVGVSIVVSSAILATTVRAGLERAARDTVGADVQLSAPRLDDDIVAGIAGADGVRDAAALTIIPGVPFQDSAGQSGVFVLLADTATLHGIRPDLPVLGDGEVLVSADWADRVRGDDIRIGEVPARVAGTVAPGVLPGVSTRWILADSSVADRLGVDLPRPERVLVALDPGADPAVVTAALVARVRETQPEDLRALVVGRDVATALADARTPAIASLEGSLLLAAGAALVLTALVVVLASASVATRRNRLIGVLRVLGMSAHQIRSVLAWELGPLALVALVVGTALGLLLPVIVTAVLDLRPFVGGRDVPGVVVDPLVVGTALLAFVAVVAGSGLVATALGRRLAPAGALKMGES